VANESKPFASLSSGLLARKGAARPAMRPQGFSQAAAGLEDLGWDDMGFEPPKPAAIPAPDADHDAFGEDVVEHPRAHPTGLTPVHSPVHTQQAEIADRFGAEDDEAVEEFDETAELYQPEAGDEPRPVLDQLSAAIAPVVVEERAAPKPPGVRPAPQPSVRPAPQPSAAPGGKAKAAFTLRLDPQRHLKLRLACAVNGRSAQQIVTAALDQLLTEMPELDAMAEKAKPKR
jgi:hypothetical protein